MGAFHVFRWALPPCGTTAETQHLGTAPHVLRSGESKAERYHFRPHEQRGPFLVRKRAVTASISKHGSEIALGDDDHYRGYAHG
jgi:hypothetical protein